MNSLTKKKLLLFNLGLTKTFEASTLDDLFAHAQGPDWNLIFLEAR